MTESLVGKRVRLKRSLGAYFPAGCTATVTSNPIQDGGQVHLVREATVHDCAWVDDLEFTHAEPSLIGKRVRIDAPRRPPYHNKTGTVTSVNECPYKPMWTYFVTLDEPVPHYGDTTTNCNTSIEELIILPGEPEATG